MVDFEMLDSPEYRQNHRDKTNLYLWLRRHIRRGPWQDDPLDIYGNYYKKGRLATSRSLRRLATDFGVKNTTAINRWINELEQEGAFKIEKGNIGKHKPQNIYVLYINARKTS